MKQLNQTNTKTDWENDLVKDLSFIKEKRRYPINKKTFRPAIIAAILITVLSRLGLAFIITQNSPGNITEIIVACILVILIISLFYKYYQTLIFQTITTRYNLHRNQDLLTKFFKTSHLAYTQHDDAPEVYMIISRNLNNNPEKEYREIMVFVVDDKRILVNSHFSGNKFSITPPSRNFKKMAKELDKWLDRHIDKANIQDISVKGF